MPFSLISSGLNWKTVHEQPVFFPADIQSYARTIWPTTTKFSMVTRGKGLVFWQSVRPSFRGGRTSALPNCWTSYVTTFDRQIMHVNKCGEGVFYGGQPRYCVMYMHRAVCQRQLSFLLKGLLSWAFCMPYTGRHYRSTLSGKYPLITQLIAQNLTIKIQYKKLSRRWQTARRIWANAMAWLTCGYDILNTRPSHI